MMRIGNTDECTLCGTPFKFRKIFQHGWEDEERKVKEMTLITAHAGCRSLLKRKKQLEQQLLDLEYEIYCKSTFSQLYSA